MNHSENNDYFVMHLKYCTVFAMNKVSIASTKQIVRSLLKDAVIRTIKAAEYAGIRALVVHALSEDTKEFYLRHGFLESPLNQFMLMLLLPTGLRSLPQSE